jgi:hypothetical protein
VDDVRIAGLSKDGGTTLANKPTFDFERIVDPEVACNTSRAVQ